MTDGTNAAPDPSFLAMERALTRLSDARDLNAALDRDVIEAALRDVRRTFEISEASRRRSNEEVLMGYVAELVAVSSLSHMSTYRETLSDRQIMDIKKFIRKIFNGLFDR